MREDSGLAGHVPTQLDPRDIPPTPPPKNLDDSGLGVVGETPTQRLDREMARHARGMPSRGQDSYGFPGAAASADGRSRVSSDQLRLSTERQKRHGHDQPVELPAGDDVSEKIIMSPTSYPGQEWIPGEGERWD